MENQHRQIKGYRELSQTEIDMMNRIKALGEQLDVLTTDLRSEFGSDKRWLEEGKTDLQKGIMCLVRSVAKPTTF